MLSHMDKDRLKFRMQKTTSLQFIFFKVQIFWTASPENVYLDFLKNQFLENANKLIWFNWSLSPLESDIMLHCAEQSSDSL